MSDSNSISNFSKFKLLLWKDLILQLARMMDIVLSIIFLLLICSIFLALRYYFAPVATEKIIPKPIDLTTISDAIFIFSKDTEKGILYSPKNDVYDAIVNAAIKKLDLDSCKGFKDAKELDVELLTQDYLVGVKFPNSMSSYPKEFAFDLRFPARRRSNPFAGSWNMNTKKGAISIGEPYEEEGFLQIQNALVISYIEHENKNAKLPSVEMRKYPEIIRSYDVTIVILSLSPIFLEFCYFYPTICIVIHVAQERETQIKEIMQILGLQNWIHWLAWFVKSFIIMAIVSVLIVLIFCVKIFANGALLIKSSPTALLFLLLLYNVATIFFVFAIVVCFKRTKYAVITNLLLFLLPLLLKPMVKDFYAQIAICLVPHIVLMNIINFVTNMEDKDIGLKWAQIFRIYKKGTISPLICILMLVADTIIYFLLCLYIEQINTGEYGISKKWYFPFQRKFWRNKSNDRSSGGANGSPRNSMEVKKIKGLSVQHLTKKFGGFTAVNDLSFDMYQNEITVLLGRNGAGKSTTILMLTGLLEPTSGTAFIHGHDIRTDMSRARESLGLCPQQNALFNDLTVNAHIYFFSWVKGIQNKNDINAEIKKYTEIMELTRKKKTYAKNLSGGMKRKLCLCCALCGSPKVVLCDEPSSGVDPSARRHFWALLQAEKTGKTILLTTHFMDEADALADRIVIIANGEHRYSGTIFDMKKRFGKGYCLTCDMQEDCIPNNVTTFLQSRIPNITLIRERGHELTYRLPPDESAKYASLFRDIEYNIDRLRLTGFGIGISTVEEVFTQITSGKNNTESTPKNRLLWRNFHIFSESLLIRETLGRKCQQIKGLFLKRKFIMRRSWILLLIVLLLPMILLLILYFLVREENILKDLPALPIEITSYDEGEVWLESPANVKGDSSEKRLIDAYKAYTTSFGPKYKLKNLKGEEFATKMLDIMEIDDDITQTVLVAASINTNEITAWMNPVYGHTSPLTLNFVHNAMAREYVNSDAKVRVTNAPLPFKQEDHKITEVKNAENIYFFISCIMAAFILLPINERVSGIKTQQMLSGIDIFSYWLTFFLVDFLIAIFIVCTMLFIIACFGEEGYNTVTSIVDHFTLIGFFVLAGLPQVYVFSYLFSSVGLGCTMMIVFYEVGNIICMILSLFLRKSTLNIIGVILPKYNLEKGTQEIKNVYQLEKMCKQLRLEFQEEDVCLINKKCCPIPKLYTIVGNAILFFLLSFALYMFLLLLLESRIGLLIRSKLGILRFWKLRQLQGRETINTTKEDSKGRKNKKKKKDEKSQKNKTKKKKKIDEFKDEDVALEEERIKMMSKDERSDLPLVVDRISKKFTGYPAVREISFLVKPKQCFGLLGVNGAGKTTTFEMLIGNQWIDKGHAYCNGNSLRSLMRKPIQVGYCPQQDCLFENLTGRENLLIYCHLHGIRTNAMKRLSNVLAVKFDFVDHMHKKTKNLSGGNKRKLCAIISILGNPCIIYLDEPSSGMDPLARRQLWQVVSQLREMGKPIVLTSHSMEECEALCTRVTIMVAGRLRCLGSTQHLKNKYSQGYILKINVKTSGPTTSQKASLEDKTMDYLQSAKENIKEFIANRIPNSELKEEYEYVLSYNISIQSMKYSEIFDLMEKNRSTLQIDDYTIAQTSLDDIFIEFSKIVDTR